MENKDANLSRRTFIRQSATARPPWLLLPLLWDMLFYFQTLNIPILFVKNEFLYDAVI